MHHAQDIGVRRSRRSRCHNAQASHQLPIRQAYDRQDFDAVKVYYDDGQKSVAQAIHKAVDYALSKEAMVYWLASSSDYRLSQIAD